MRDSAARQRFEEIWDEHYAAIFSFARRRLSADEAAQDVAAETFLVAWRRLDEVPADPGAWLFKVARNVLSNYSRGRGRRQALQARLMPACEAYELVKCEGVVMNVVGTAKKDTLKGTKKKDGILGLGGNDKLSGKKGKDGLCGGKGKDKLKGGPGKDKLDGGPGKDKLDGGPGKDKEVQ